MKDQPTDPQWVCEHCLFHLVNGDCTEVDTCSPGSGDENDPMRLFDGMYATPGTLSEHHECQEGPDERDDDCECETNPFSWSACDGCGSPLGGARYAVTGWIPANR